MTLGERIRKIRQSQIPKLSQSAFGEATGASRAQIKTYELDAVVAPDSYLKLLCLKFDVTYDWLKEGIGEMEEPPENIETLDAIDRILQGENEFAKFLFRKAARLDKSVWNAIEKELREYFDENK